MERAIEAILSAGHGSTFSFTCIRRRTCSTSRPEARQIRPGTTHTTVTCFAERSISRSTCVSRRVGYDPVAYRSGAYHICDDFLAVLPEFGISIDSSLYPFKNCRVSDWMHTHTEPFWVGDVLEVPVSWLIRTSGQGKNRALSREQLAPVGGGAQQDAVASYLPAATSPAPATLVYLLIPSR